MVCHSNLLPCLPSRVEGLSRVGRLSRKNGESSSAESPVRENQSVSQHRYLFAQSPILVRRQTCPARVRVANAGRSDLISSTRRTDVAFWRKGDSRYLRFNFSWSERDSGLV